MGFSQAELAKFRGKRLPDLVGPRTRVLFVGINPGLWTAAAQSHFSRRGNRFYPALFHAGIVDRLIDASAGYRPEDREHLLERGVGITNIVPVATARADELTRDELVAGGRALVRRVRRIAPDVVAVLGISAYREVAVAAGVDVSATIPYAGSARGRHQLAGRRFDVLGVDAG